MLYALSFINKITPVDKLMNGLGATSKVIGEDVINSNLRYDYVLLHRIQFKAYHVPSKKYGTLALNNNFIK